MARLPIFPRKLVGRTLVALTTVMTVGPRAAAPRFVAVALATLGGDTSFPLAMSDDGADDGAAVGG